MAVILKLALVISILGSCCASECCDSYFNVFGNYVDAQWCSDYCCGTLTTGLTCCIGSCYASECCDSYFNVFGNYVDAQWCSDYCCGTLTTGLTCCSDILLQADWSDRSDFCGLWWKHHIWAPILIGVANILIIACCCFCCYKCCCATSNRTTIVYQPGMMPGGGGVQVQQITTSQQQQSSMGSFGYDQSPKY